MSRHRPDNVDPEARVSPMELYERHFPERPEKEEPDGPDVRRPRDRRPAVAETCEAQGYTDVVILTDGSNRIAGTPPAREAG